ncbi:MAG: DNA repair protein RadC [Endomicrobiaceae bacterium]|nr:DNA repair protein RadC [Endomicrobiaceae bacterium]MDD3923093.1 DNA repair protein RadC [Endomicrobiaceae bacterium]
METNDRKKYNIGHRKRLKEKFLNSKFDNWQDYEILEFALTFALPQKDTKQIAKKLIEKVGSLKELLQADCKDILNLKIEGISEHSAIFILFLKYFSIKYSEIEIKEKEKLSSPKDVIIFLKSVIGTSEKEIFYAIFLSASNKVLDYQIISKGIVNRSAVYPREIVKLALDANATSVIISHNHPGGTCKPSQNDIIATEAVLKALKTVDITLIDHIIVISNNYYSFKDNGLI